MTRMGRVVWALGILALLSPMAVMASSVEVQVGYADNLRPSPFFPNPWAGGANVQYFLGEDGSGPNGVDSGAIRIINNGSSAVTIQALHVDSFGDGADFNIWGGLIGGGLSLAPGMSAIFDQTVAYNFDSSDDEGSNPFAIPVVHVTIDGVTIDLSDTAQVLNTEGTDHLAANGLNESHQWRDIGTYGGQGVPEPGTLGLLFTGVAGAFAKLRQRL